MARKVALVGIPLEEVCLNDIYEQMTTYIPGITDKERALVMQKASGRGIAIEDLGELYPCEKYQLKYRIERLEGIPSFLAGSLVERDMALVEQARTELIRLTEDYDLVVALGPSHLGAITLYRDHDRVARYDYHADFCGRDPDRIYYSNASYMDWVKANLNDVSVINYCMHWSEKGLLDGEKAGSLEDPRYLCCGHFDIDVDAVDDSFQVQDIYPHSNGSTNLCPSQLVRMIHEAQPERLGFWEYRLSHDRKGAGMEMIVDSIAVAAQTPP